MASAPGPASGAGGAPALGTASGAGVALGTASGGRPDTLGGGASSNPGNPVTGMEPEVGGTRRTGSEIGIEPLRRGPGVMAGGAGGGSAKGGGT